MKLKAEEDVQMKKPVLVIMAAGMGSRYGGLKQIDPVDREGHIIMDFSIYDAKKAGFEKVVFIIKKENEKDFKDAVGRRIEKVMDTAYVYQELDSIPEGFAVPEGRVKPWGTAHAILCAAGEIDSPFAVINADDYYGRSAFEKIYQYLTTHEDDEKYRYTMVGYRLINTVTDNGYVSRGVCALNEKNELVSVTERTRIEKRGSGVAYSEDGGSSWTEIAGNTLVSPENEASFDLATVGNVTFEWDASEASDGGYVSYEVLFDTADGDFSKPVAEMPSALTGSDTKLTVNTKNLNETALKAGISAGKTGTLKWTVRASKGIYGSIYSQVNTIIVTTLAE